MNFPDLIRARYSVRAFKNTPVTDEQIYDLLESAHMAPSACNRQPWEVHVVRIPTMLAKIYKAYPRDWFATAPCVLVLVSNHEESWKRPIDGKDHADIDIAILADHITLMATELGLGSCWVCHFDKDIIRAALGIKDHKEPAILIPMGVPDIEPKAKTRKTLDEIVHYW